MKNIFYCSMFICLCFVGFANAADTVITEGFEYSTTTELYAAGWSHLYGSPGDMVMADSSVNSRLPRSGAYCLLAPGPKSPNIIQKTFFGVGIANATVEFYLRHRTISGLNASYSWMRLIADDGTYIYLYFDQNTGSLLYKLNGGAQTVAPGYIVDSTEDTEFWNKFTIEYVDGEASVYLNDQLQFIYPDAKNFSTIALGKSWSTNAAAQSAYDDLSIYTGNYCGDKVYSQGDLNRDCVVNLVDFVLLSEDWLNESLVSFVPEQSDIYENFEYGNWMTMGVNGWYPSHSTDPVISSEFSRSKSESLTIPSGTLGGVQKTFFAESRTDIEVSISQLEQDGVNPGSCAVEVFDADNNYVMFMVGYEAAAGGTVVQARYNNSTKVPYPAITVPDGWNDLRFVFDSAGDLDLYLNDTHVGSTSVLSGFSKIAILKPWTTLGSPHWDRLTIVESPATSSGFCDQDDPNGLSPSDYNDDCAVNVADLVIFAGKWLNESTTIEQNYTSLSGTVMSVNGDQVECMIGVDIVDEQGNPRNASGAINTTPYGGNVIWHNRYVDDGNDWSLPEIVIPEGETWTAWLEIYPKDGGVTDVSQYVRTAWHAIPITANETINDINIVLGLTSEAATVSGILTDNGSPVSGQSIRLWGNGVNTAFDFANTDASGYFEFTHVQGWARDKNDPSLIVSPIGVRLWVNGEQRKAISGVSPNAVITGQDFDLQD